MEEVGDGGCRGCMGAFRHLLDFTHPRKKQSLQSGCQESEAPNKSPEKKNMPTENVNVVARLMGLERMAKDDEQQWRSSRSKPPLKHLSLTKSRSLNTLSETLDPPTPAVDMRNQKLHFRSHSFRERPQDKQLQEFKRNFEATQRFHYREHSHSENKHNHFQQRSDGAGAFLLKDTPGKRHNQSKDFVEALEYLQNKEKIFLRALHNPNSFLATQIQSQYTHKTSSQEWSVKQLGSTKISSPSLANHNHAIPLHSKPSKNSVNQLLAKVAVLEPNSANAKNTNQQLKTYRESRFSREIPFKRERKLKGKCSRKASQELYSKEESSGSDSLLQTIASSHNSSAKGEEYFPNASRVSSRSGKSSPGMGMQCSPMFRKEISKEEARKVSECLRDSDKKNLPSKPCSVTRRNRDVRDRIAAGHSSSGEFAIASSKKGLHRPNLMLKVKPLNEKTTLALANYKDRKPGVTEENENALAKDVINISTEDETEDAFLKYPVANRVNDCEEVLASIGEKCELPSPISVLDGHFQQESPSPINIKENATNLH
ncbi:hypothetical protein KI387_026714, partial [Taxus chinensis]